MFNLAFWKATAERAVKTFAQTLAALLVADGTDLLTTNWADRLSVAGMAAVVSLLTSIASASVGEPGPSVAGETLTESVAAVEAPAKVPADYVAGPAATVPEGTPVDVEPTTYSGDSKADAAYHGKHE